MSTIKAGRHLIDIVKISYASNTPCLITGPHGVGKSVMLQQAASELGIGFQTVNLALCENVDLQGVPSIKDNTTIYNPPAFLPSSGCGILSLEEINRADRSVLSCALLLLSMRQLGSYSLPPGWLPVASANPSDGYDVNEMDPALLSRFLRVTVEADVREWLLFAEKNDIHPSVYRFVRNTPNIFDTSDSSPRSWSYVSNVLRAYEKDGGGNEGLLTTSVCGLVGDAIGVAFVQSHLNAEEPLSVDAILHDFDRHKSTVEEWAKTKRTDLMNATAHALLVGIQNTDLCAEIAKTESMQANLAVFISTLPGDISKKVRAAAKKAGVLS